jgi:hypothetical protein
MYATMRRYDAVDNTRKDELIRMVDETLAPRLSKLPGFGGYHVIDAGDGVVATISLFETSEQADESTRLARTWVRDEKLEAALPRPPMITCGEVVVHKPREVVPA